MTQRRNQMIKERTENIAVVRFGEIIFTKAKVIFFNKKNQKGIFYVEGTCSGRKMQPVKVSVLISQNKRQCPSCKKDILWFIKKTKVNILNYFLDTNELSVRIEIICRCGVTNTFVLLLPLTEIGGGEKEKVGK